MKTYMAPFIIYVPGKSMMVYINDVITDNGLYKEFVSNKIIATSNIHTETFELTQYKTIEGITGWDYLDSYHE
jgi:hypothetical protein